MEKRNWKKIIGLIVLITLVFSVGYSVVKIIMTPEVAIQVGDHTRSDYVLMLLQCCLGLVVFWLPSMLEKKFSWELPNYMCIMYFVFLYCAIYLGDVRNFYYIIPHWDTVLHCFSGGMLGALGFTLVEILNDTKNIKVKLSPVFVCLFAFCFALAAGVVWEIYEFIGDSLLGLNMQKYRDLNTIFVGRDALSDTMIDLIVDTIGAFIVVCFGYLSLKGREKIEEKRNKQ